MVNDDRPVERVLADLERDMRASARELGVPYREMFDKTIAYLPKAIGEGRK
jgi:hypothetical protein